MHAKPDFPNEARAALGRPGFWIAVLRETVPVVGVLAFGWPAFAAALYFIVESWLYLSLRASTEIVIDPKYAGKDLPRSTPDAVAKIAKHLSYVLPFFAILLGLFAGFVMFAAFPKADWAAFAAGGWREPEVLWGFGVLLASVIADTVRHARRFATRTSAEAEAGDLSMKLMFYRVTFGLFPAAFLLGLAGRWGLAPPLIVLAIALISIAIEAIPRSIVAWLEEPQRRGPP